MDPLTALVVAVWAAYYLVRDGIDGVTSARGNIPHGAVNRHTERMQRMQQSHERWMARHADQRKLRERGHSTIGRALQDRVAKWVENAGRRVDRADEAVRAAEEKDIRLGRAAGSWRTSWRRARQAMAQKWRNVVERAEERLSDRYDRERPFVPTDPTAKVVTEDTPQPEEPRRNLRDDAIPGKPTAPPPPADDQTRERVWAYAERLDASPAISAGSTTGKSTNTQDDVVDAEIVEEPDCGSSHECPPSPTGKHVRDTRETTLGTRTGCVHCGDGFKPARLFDENQTDGSLFRTVQDWPVAISPTEAPTGEPKTPASPEAAAPPTNVIPINRGERMSQPTQTLVLSSGAITPESGKNFADGGSDVLTQVASFTQNAVADMTAAKVAPEQIAEFTEAMNLVLAAKSKFGSMSENFTNHLNAKAVVNSVGAGTDADYLGTGGS